MASSLTIQVITPFALRIAYSLPIWVVITQIDKLILSGVLPLTEFGYFSIVALIAGLIILLFTAFSPLRLECS